MRDAVLARSYLRVWLETAVNPAQQLPVDGRFIGNENGIEFYAQSQMGFSEGGVVLSITVQEIETGFELVVREITRAGTTLGEYRMSLTSPALGLEMSYYDGRAQDWLSEWTDPERLPDLVRILSDDGILWPDFYARPRLGAS
ncbi:hypothetical protein [Gymnodinialimonas sp.]